MRRTCLFVAGLAVLLFAVDSGVGVQADQHLADHMIEHLLMWLVAAPLLAAGAPVRLILFVLGPAGRRSTARVLHSRTVRAVTNPSAATFIFCAVIVVTASPPVFDLTLRNEYVHVAEHALYLIAACLMWAPLVAVDPLPHHPTGVENLACGMSCMTSMTVVSVWLLLAPAPVYQPYEQALGAAGALHDQRLAALIMLLAAAPALAVSLIAGLGARLETLRLR